MKEAGLPDGVFNVVNGDKESVEVLPTDKRIQAVSFVGSTPIAEYIYSTASAYGKRVQALGVQKPHGVMPDADPIRSLAHSWARPMAPLASAAWPFQLRSVQGEAVADKLVNDLVAEINTMKVGAGEC